VVDKIKKVTGRQLMAWPEFKAFADRLGIDIGLPTVAIELKIPLDERVEIIQRYIGQDTKDIFADTIHHHA
jgi:hypothetical protein